VTIVAVQQNNRRTFAPLDVLQADAINRSELTSRRMLALSFPRAINVVCHHCRQRGRRG
jgi:hypothetical protein